MVQIHRLGDVTVGVQIVSPQDVLLSLGSGKHYHRDSLELRIPLDYGQYFPPVSPWQIQIQEDQVGNRRVRISAFATEKG